MNLLKRTLSVGTICAGLLAAGLTLPTACSKSPTSPATPTFTFTPTPTNWAGYTSTFTSTPTITYTGTISPTFTVTGSLTPTVTPPYQPPNTSTPTNSSTPSSTPTATDTFSLPAPTIVHTSTLTITPSFTPTPTGQATSTFTLTGTLTSTSTPVGSATATPIVAWQVNAPNALAQNPINGNIYVAYGAPPAVAGGIEIFNINGTPLGSFTAYTGQQPNGVAVDSTGSYVYVVDQNGAVYVFNSTGTSLLCTFNNGWTTSTSGPTAFNEPEGIALDSTNKVYVADTGNGWVEIFDAFSSTAPSSSVTEWNTWSGGASVTFFSEPSAIALDSANNIYVGDADGGFLDSGVTNGGLVDVFSSQPSPVYTAQWPTLSNSDIFGLAVNGTNVYVADAYNGQIEEYTTAGILEVLWTGPYPPANSSPDGVIVVSGGPSNGQVLVTDWYNNLVEDFSPP